MEVGQGPMWAVAPKEKKKYSKALSFNLVYNLLKGQNVYCVSYGVLLTHLDNNL
jgi:hypothetical protein